MASTSMLTGNDRAYGTIQGSPPTDEIGAIVASGLSPWSAFAFDELEQVPELQFPMSIRTYAAMRNDSQIEGLYAGSTMPIRRYKWMIDPNGCDPERVKLLAADLGLPVKGDDPTAPKGRAKNRFVFRQHLKDAMLSILYGFYPFEQVGYIDDNDLWHLRKLAPRPPITVDQIRLAQDGGLLTIIQNVSSGMKSIQTGFLPEIPVDRLVMYSFDKEGANWQGRSMLRAIYRNWLIKDRLLRVDAVKHERNGMGVPHATGAQNMTPDELKALSKLASAYKAGESSGTAFPYGSSLELLGVKGTLPDTIASINFHNEEMSRRFLMMFLQLGSTLHGSRSLGKDFVDYFQLAQEELANWFLDVFNEHVIEDYWDWNYGEQEDLVPLVTYERDDDPRFAAADLALMIQNGAVQVDDEVEQAVREAMDLPAFDPKSERTYLPGNSPEDKMKLAQEMKPPGVGDQPNQDSTQPGNSDPKFPDQKKDDLKASAKRLPAATATSPASPSGASGIGEWTEAPDAL